MPLHFSRPPADSVSMDNSVIGTLAQALDFGSARLQAISNNLTNVNTPGYKRKDVSFDALLKSAQEDGDLPMLRTDPRHLSPGSADGGDSPTPTVVTEGGDAMRADGNNVDVDAEANRLAAAQIYYQGAAQLIQNQFAALKYVIGQGN
ncbi:MAG: flagellar basal body rod protein FlgB [Armatimonadetes bacterium]|nr:flagellar basal body rod protein FlgB [Armatimonadota bacterium]